MAVEGQLRFDVAIFADTQDEPDSVYAHLDWLETLSGPTILVRTAGRLGDDLIHGRNSTGQRFASIPAFTKSAEGKVGKVRRQCTSEYKIRVCERTIRRELVGLKPYQRMPPGTTVVQYFGISKDEEIRAIRAKDRFLGLKWCRPEYPLLDLGWSRRDCGEYLRGRVPHPVPKSACVFCPFKTNQAWKELKATDPAGWRRAVEVDNALRAEGSVCNRKLDQQLYVHRSCVPLEVIDFDRLAPSTLDPMTVGECHGMCGV
jgi:hypothetical protein